MLRNSIGVIVGLVVALVLIMFGIMLKSNWSPYDYITIYEHWNRVIKQAAKGSYREEFFIALLFFEGLGAMVGGFITALIVKKAKRAYAVLVGFILFIIAFLDICFTAYHPTWYEILLLPVLFFFSWLGGLVTEIIMRLVFKKQKP